MEPPSDPTTSIHVVGLCGSLRSNSMTRTALRVALRGAESNGAETRLIDLEPYTLPFCRGKEQEVHYPENVQRFRADIAWGDGIILATPEYHGSFSGVLKNALDLLGFEEFEGKMVGLVGVSGGRLGGSDAMNQLRSIGRVLHAWVVPTQAWVSEAYAAFDELGEPKIASVTERLMSVGHEVTHFARLHKCGEHLEFVKAWERAPVNPGGSRGSSSPTTA
ncbi:MAG: NADPH-dependent FMN reductase [Thermoplasmata archaeon]